MLCGCGNRRREFRIFIDQRLAETPFADTFGQSPVDLARPESCVMLYKRGHDAAPGLRYGLSKYRGIH